MQLLWVEGVDDLHETLARHMSGEATDFTRYLFHLRIRDSLGAQVVSQLLDNELTIETVMSFQVKKLVSYRYCVVPDPEARARLVDLLWGGVSKHGVPKLPRPQ